MIGWRDEAGRRHEASLFGTFAALARGEAWSFPALRPHQREPWHAFTVQVAALALIGAGTDVLPETEEAWHGLLHALTPDHPTAWDLVVDDWTKPALLQPPVVTAANKADYKNRLPTPDALDMLVTSKNHDVKQERIDQASEEDWLFALVTLQTSEGYGGAGNHGISRMNGGLSSRMTLGVRPAGASAAAFRRDVRRLVGDAGTNPERRTGLALLWLEPWDGTRALDFTTLDTLYVEICRRVRLTGSAGGIAAVAATSKCARVAAKELLGRTGDPWAPVKADGSSSVTPSAAGFGYRALARLLDRNEVTPPLLAGLHPDDDRDNLSIVVAALVRGQGKTEGLHRRHVRTTRVTEIEETGDTEVLDRIGDVANTRTKEAVEAARRLRRALIMLVQGGPEQARLDDDSANRRADPWVRRLDAQADRIFFDDAFWSEAAGDSVNHRFQWRKTLRDLASEVFEEAALAAPRSQTRRLRAIVRARSVLDGQMYKWVREVADDE